MGFDMNQKHQKRLTRLTNMIYIDALKNSSFREEFTYKINIPNDINKEKIRSMVIQIEKKKLYGLASFLWDSLY